MEVRQRLDIREPACVGEEAVEELQDPARAVDKAFEQFQAVDAAP